MRGERVTGKNGECRDPGTDLNTTRAEREAVWEERVPGLGNNMCQDPEAVPTAKKWPKHPSVFP